MKRPFSNEEEELQFLRKVVHTLPSFINVNQIDKLEEASTSYVIWSNQQVYDFVGYTREEITDLGFEFFLQTIHPEDVEIIGNILNRYIQGDLSNYGGLLRIKLKDDEYHWFIGSLAVLETKDNKPWRIIVNIQNIESMKDSQNQIIHLIKENLQLKNQLKIRRLSSREKEIVKYIAGGKTDKEIASALSISPATVKTHRHNIIQKLHVKNKAGIAQFATEIGLD